MYLASDYVIDEITILPVYRDGITRSEIESVVRRRYSSFAFRLQKARTWGRLYLRLELVVVVAQVEETTGVAVDLLKE